MAHEIVMLGTGNAFLPNGRHHSFAIIDKRHIVDAPPTSLISLRQHGLKVCDIETIFITHLHGDHIFGLPFLLLERTYISDRELVKPLTIIAAPGARQRIEHLCEIAYPGSMENILRKIRWNDNVKGKTQDGWSWERFVVNHNDSVDPYGYSFSSDNGAQFVHSGDSGPCETLSNAISNTDLVIIEMSIPEWVPSEHHHKPSDIDKLSRGNEEKKFIITHTYIDDRNSKFPTITESKFPSHPSNVHHASDGDTFIWNNGHWKRVE
tara:strand:- start:526 stop:1320 length:795 start_codon:yes stop_codon:yes gene_type:complete